MWSFNVIGYGGEMKYGVSIFATDTSIRPDELAVAAESRGFESIWFPEHSHIPVSRRTPWGGREGAPPLPEQYWHTLDQFVALAYAAAATERIEVCTGITLLAQRDPVWTAKEVASLDHLSGGRAVFGIGYGWNKEEMASHGVGYSERRALLREKVLMMKSLWTDDEAAFEGEKLTLEPSWAWPKPVQKPHPPIIMGAEAGPKTIADMVEFCDGWMPIAARHDVESRVGEIRSALSDAGRDADAFRLIAWGPQVDDLDRLRSMGFRDAVFSLPPLGSDVVIEKLDELASALEL